MTEQKTLQEVYEDRNAAVIGLATVATYLRSERPTMAIRACWQPDDGDDADADEWAIVYVWLPTGQASWHVPRDLVEDSAIPRKFAEWDGHDREVKNERVLSFAETGK
jgi:hypothetical protein